MSVPTTTIQKKTLPIAKHETPYKERRQQLMPTPGKPRSINFLVNEMSIHVNLSQEAGIVIGRGSEDNPVQIDLEPMGGRSAGVSRIHAVIEVIDNRVVVRDNTSTNGTYLNGFLLEPRHPYRLYDEDTLVLGKLILNVHFVY